MNTKKNKTLVPALIVAAILMVCGHAEAKMTIHEVLPGIPLDGGGAVGNGGGTVVCRNADQSIKSVELLDFFEARVVRGITIDISTFPGNWKAKAQTVIDRLGAQSMLRQKIYSLWLNSFESDRKILQGVTFNNVPDAMNIGVPKGCEFEQAALQIIPRFPGDFRYYLNDELWAAMDDNQKAGLVLHEIVYREALAYGQTDSVASRYFVGLISSPAIAAMTIDDFVDSLERAKFEQTDIPAVGSLTQMKLTFNPLNWWRVNVLDKKSYPAPVELTGRMIINLGHDQDGEWLRFRDMASIQNAKATKSRVCSGVETISLPGMKHPIQVNYKVKDPKYCKYPFEYGEFADSPGGFLVYSFEHNGQASFDYQYSERNSVSGNQLDFSLQDRGFLLIGATVTEFKIPTLHVWSTHTDRSYCSLMTYFTDDHINSLSMRQDFEGGNADPTACHATLVFVNPDQKTVSTLTIDYKTNGIVNVDPNGIVSTKISLDKIENKKSNAAWGCSSESLQKCIDVLSVDSNRLQVKNGSGYFVEDLDIGNGNVTRFEAYVQNGVYEVYPETLVPHTLIIRSDCEMPSVVNPANGMPQSQSVAKFSAGSILSFDMNGVVTSVLSGVSR